MKIALFTDSCCDLPINYIKANDINFVSMSVILNGSTYKDDFGLTLDSKAFFDKLRQGLMSTTSQINVNEYFDAFKPFIERGETILYIGFSSALSGSLNSAHVAREMLLNEYPNANIIIIDSKCASLGEGLLVYYVNKLIKSGKSLDEILDFINKNYLRVSHFFTVDDLNYLKLGGRISLASATIGSFLSIKPILHVDDEGKLKPLLKVKGRKKSIKALYTYVEKFIVNANEQTIFICHGDCIEDANALRDMIHENLMPNEIIINSIGKVIGSHAGPGTLGVFFIGKNR